MGFKGFIVKKKKLINTFSGNYYFSDHNENWIIGTHFLISDKNS